MNKNLVFSEFSVYNTRGQITEAFLSISHLLVCKKINKVKIEAFIRLFRLVIRLNCGMPYLILAHPSHENPMDSH